MASLAALRKQAKEMGVPKGLILRAENADELQAIIGDFKDHETGSGSTSKPKTVAKKKAAAKAVAKKKTSGGNSERKQNRKKTTAKKSGSNRAPAKSGSGTAKRRGNAKPKRSNGYVAKGGRNTISKVNFSNSDGWNPREDSAPDVIIRTLKKVRGDRDKAFEILKKDIWDFVNKKNVRGEKRNKADAEAMLRYRISRTLFDFAVRTGQHEASTNRVQYGTGGTGEGIYKPQKARARKTASKPKAKTASRKKASSARKKASSGRKKTSSRAKAGSRR